MPRKKQQKSSLPRLNRHPNYFLVLGSFLFLAAIASFLLVLSVLMQQSQDLRQQADEVPLPDLSISVSQGNKKGYLLTEPIEIQVTVNNRGNAPVTTPFNVTIAVGNNPSADGTSVGAGFSTSVPVIVPIPAGGSHNLTTTIPAGTLGPGSYALRTVPDPIAENAVIERIEDDIAYDSNAFTILLSIPTPGPATPASPSPSPAVGVNLNLYFAANHSLQFYKESTNESIKTTDIVAGERYKVRHTARIQSDPKNPNSNDARSVIAQFRANDSGLTTKNFALSQVERAAGGIDLVFETTFTGSTNNSFVTTLDSGNGVAETNENDNTLTTTYTYQVATTTTQKTYAGCNDTCSTNRDCSAGLACSSGRCRNPSAVSSTNCQVPAAAVGGTQKSTEQTNTTGAKGAAIGGPVATAPSSSPTPRTQPTPLPSATPLVTPTPTLTPEELPTPQPEVTSPPEPTPTPTDLEGELLAWFNQLLLTLQQQLGLTNTINPLWIWLIIGGIALLVILLLVSLLRRKHHDTTLPVVPPPVTTPTGPVTPPPTVRPITSAPMTTSPTPQAPPAPPPSSSMVAKLQSRGVIKPSSSTPNPPDPPTV